MKFCSVLRTAALAGGLWWASASWGAGPDDIYLDAYRLIQEADQIAPSQPKLARQRYLEAQTNLKKLQGSHPAYSRTAVEYRLEYVSGKLGALPADPEAASPAAAAESPAEPAATPAPLDLEAGQRLARLQADNAMLQAKLQEALAARPAAIDPAELARSQERIAQLEKEKELLRVGLAQSEARQPQAVDQALFDQTKTELEATRRKLIENVATVASLAQENEKLRQQAAAPAKPIVAAPPETGGRIKELEAERDALARKLSEANEANQARSAQARGPAAPASIQTLTNQLANLRARLEVYEARKVPYTKEELALMERNVPKLAAVPETKAAKKTAKELPAGAGPIVLEAERAFSRRRYAEAEQKYQQVLDMDPENPLSLANLAAIKLELQKLDEASAHLSQANRLNPDDPYTLSLLGMLRFQQGSFDEALDSLGRSAQLDPKNAETQNYLGITLSQKGQREAAETALRKAIQLNPGYAGAHHNLAVIYATQQPPYLELAKFHYNRALSLGQPNNADLEQRLGAAGK